MSSHSWSQLPVLKMRDLGLSFSSLDSSLDRFSSSWGGSKKMMMVSGSVKGHALCRVSKTGWSSLVRVEEWAVR